MISRVHIRSRDRVGGRGRGGPGGNSRGRGRTLPAAALLVALVAVLAGCGTPAGAPGGSAAQPERVWRSDGYGWVYALRGNRLAVYEVTAISCLRGEQLERTGGADPDGALEFGSDDTAEQTLRIRPDGGATVHVIGTAADVDLLPLPAVPELCARKPAGDPVTTFDVFWATFAENYNSLAGKQVDWAAVRDRYRPRVTASTDDQELFGILREMIEPFGDTHTGIEGSNDSDNDLEFAGLRQGTRELSARTTGRAVDNHLRALGAGEFQRFADDAIAFTELPGGRGYLRIDAFEEYDEDDDTFQASSAVLARALDAVFTPDRVRSMRSLVIDVRNNSGGDDALALQVAGRLTDRPYPAYTKAVRNHPTEPNGFGRAQLVTVTPADGPRYTGPVTLLTSDMTVSAGETFVLGMMARVPQPPRIGSTTQGVFADTLDRQLPNGWTVTLGNERYLGPDGRSYEGPGIPPTVRTPVFTPDELAANQDPALDAALQSAR